MNEVAVVGAGPAGVALAIACRQNGLPVRLYEQQPTDGPPACGSRLVELTANGTRVLHALGLKESLARIARFPSFATYRSSRTGFLISQRPLGAFSEARYGAPCCLVRADALARLLLDAARDEGISVEAPVTVAEVDTATATLVLDDHRRIPHQAVALATGRPRTGSETTLSALDASRPWLVPEDITLIRARGFRTVPDREHGRFLNTWLGPGFVVLERPDVDPEGDRQPVELLVVHRGTCEGARERHSAGEALRSLLSGCHPHLSRLAEEVEASYAEVPEADVAQTWQVGRAVALGSACHAAPPYPELEPSAALEDAWILSRMMERWEEAPHRGFPEYERFRRPRAERLRRHAESELAAHTMPRGRDRWQRDVRWSLTSRFLPEIALQKLDWLYGYDCIRGFV